MSKIRRRERRHTELGAEKGEKEQIRFRRERREEKEEECRM